jgi:hypothetical protein
MPLLEAAAQESDPKKAFLALAETGSLNGIPGFSQLKDTPQNPEWHSEGNVLIHTAIVFRNVVGDLPLFSESEQRILLAAAVIHDCQKPASMGRHPKTGAITAYGHAERAAKLVPEVGPSIFGLNKDETAKLEWVVAHHMRAHQISAEFGTEKRLAYYRHPAWYLLEKFEEFDALAGQRSDGSWGPSNRGFLKKDRLSLMNR